MEVQVRVGGALNFFPTVAAAYRFASKYKDFKISWSIRGQDFRILSKLKKEKAGWNRWEERKMCELSSKYKNARPDDRFFVNQPLSIMSDLSAKRARAQIMSTIKDEEARENLLEAYGKDVGFLAEYSDEDARDIIQGMSMPGRKVEKKGITYSYANRTRHTKR